MKERKEIQELTNCFESLSHKIAEEFTAAFQSYKLHDAFAVGMEVLRVIIANHVETCCPNISIDHKIKSIDILATQCKSLLIRHHKDNKKEKLN